MPVRKSGPLDAMLGARLRTLRVSRGISQAVLAEKIGVSFQQVQKYERGANRVGANRLARIAAVLDVSVTEFFESVRTKSPGLKSPIHLLAEPGAWQVLEAYAREPSPRVRFCIVKLMESIADRNPEAKARVAGPRGVDPGDRRKFPSRR
jgi:transcriptional regulator with XRE-family HTH domain